MSGQIQSELKKQKNMDITQIPFNKHLRLKFSHNERGDLMLEFDETMKNHLGIFHAGAQFCLAES